MSLLTISGIEPKRIWLVVVLDRVVVHQLAYVVGIVTTLLQPRW